jgi:hypothetical protein
MTRLVTTANEEFTPHSKGVLIAVNLGYRSVGRRRVRVDVGKQSARWASRDAASLGMLEGNALLEQSTDPGRMD